MILLLEYRKWMSFISKRSVLEAMLSLIILCGASIFIMGALEGWTALNTIWWFVVTVTTVGYGDMYAVTGVTKIWNMIVILGGLASAAVVVGDSIVAAKEKWRNKVKGLNDYGKMSGHVVIMTGDCGNSVDRLIEEMLADDTRADKGIVVVSNHIDEMDDPRFNFVKGELSAEDTLTRAGCATASRILIFCNNDNETILATLAVTALDDDDPAHVTAFVRTHENRVHVERISPGISIVEPLAVPMMVQEMQDKGVSDIYEELATNHGSHSIYRINIGKFQVSARDHVINGKKSIEEKSKQKITVIAAEDQNGNQVFQPDDQMVTQFLYIISDKRPEIV